LAQLREQDFAHRLLDSIAGTQRANPHDLKDELSKEGADMEHRAVRPTP
jgi:hypothetical protein